MKGNLTFYYGKTHRLFDQASIGTHVMRHIPDYQLAFGHIGVI